MNDILKNLDIIGLILMSIFGLILIYGETKLRWSSLILYSTGLALFVVDITHGKWAIIGKSIALALR